VIIKEAQLEKGQLKITKVLPEGKKEMSYEDFLRGKK
jgi:methionyl-tRNA formyltransferase